MAGDLEAMGAPQELIEEYRNEAATLDRFLVRPENWEAVLLFMSCNTQWRFNPVSGRVIGLDYAGVDACMRMRRVKPADRPRLLDQLRVMEAAAVEALGKES